jgi:phosphohistidine phosphatase SixA
MILTIWRHGEAEEGVADRQRKLTVAGRDDVGFGCRQIHHACQVREIPQPNMLLHSPWARAVQTTEIIAAAFTHADVLAERALEPGSAMAAVEALVSRHTGVDSSKRHLVLVSHQPLVSRLVGHYLGDAGSVPSISPGGLVSMVLEVSAPASGRLLFWAFPPEYEVGV